ncbi:MAG: bifunctional SulP family inorganic anion transporter/carbonic anhydrase [Opitutales bacterium]
MSDPHAAPSAPQMPVNAWGAVPKDLGAGLVVFLVALPLCLGIALASGAPMLAGIVSGVVGGMLVAWLSGSHTSISGPAAGMVAVVLAQVAALGSFEAFLVAVILAGAIQILLGALRAGFIAAFFPSNVIKGLLAAIGVIVILKQIPHAVGHDADPEGDMGFLQPDGRNTLSELFSSLFNFEPGATIVGLVSLAVLLAWDRSRLKKSLIPAPLVVVVLGVLANLAMKAAGSAWAIGSSHLVQVPPVASLGEFFKVLPSPDLKAFGNPAIIMAAVTIAAVASLETLLNLEAVDKLDPRKRVSPPNRELMAQGVGNMVSGLLGGLPITSVIVRSSVNLNAGAATRLSAFFHGVLLLLLVLLAPGLLNQIPLASLAAVLIVTGFKLASPALFRQMWTEGRTQFVPFIVTTTAIVFTDLLVGVLIGLATSLAFVLHSNYRRPLLRFMEQHVSGEVLRIELSNQVSFLNRAALEQALDSVPVNGQVVLDARNTDYIDPDILDLIDDFRRQTAPARNLKVSLVGFKDRYVMEDQIQYVDVSTREVQAQLTPERVLQFLKEGNERFVTGRRLTRDLARQVDATSAAQYPMAVILSCIDSRSPVELIFDMGVGDAFVIRIAGNVAKEKVLGSMEFACAVAGARLVLVMGHTSCGAVKAAVELFETGSTASKATGCEHLDALVNEIQKAIEPGTKPHGDWVTGETKLIYVDDVAKRNVARTIGYIRSASRTLRELEAAGKIAIHGSMYDIKTGRVTFLEEHSIRS